MEASADAPMCPNSAVLEWEWYQPSKGSLSWTIAAEPSAVGHPSKCEQELAEAIATIATLKGNVSALEVMLDAAEASCHAAESISLELRVSKDEVQQQLDAVRAELAESQVQHKAVTNTMEDTIASLTTQLLDATDNAARYKAKLIKSKANERGARNEMDGARATAEALQAALEGANKQLMHQAEAVSMCKMELEVAKASAEAWRERAEQVRAERQANFDILSAEYAAVTNTSASLRAELLTSAKLRTQADIKSAQLMMDLEEADTDIDELRAQLSQSKVGLKEQENVTKLLRVDLATAAATIAALRDQVQASDALRIEAEQRATMMMTELGELSKVVVKWEHVTQQLMDDPTATATTAIGLQTKPAEVDEPQQLVLEPVAEAEPKEPMPVGNESTSAAQEGLKASLAAANAEITRLLGVLEGAEAAHSAAKAAWEEQTLQRINQLKLQSDMFDRSCQMLDEVHLKRRLVLDCWEAKRHASIVKVKMTQLDKQVAAARTLIKASAGADDILKALDLVQTAPNLSDVHLVSGVKAGSSASITPQFATLKKLTTTTVAAATAGAAQAPQAECGCAQPIVLDDCLLTAGGTTSPKGVLSTTCTSPSPSTDGTGGRSSPASAQLAEEGAHEEQVEVAV